MTQNINDRFKTIEYNGKLLTHQETNPNIGVTHTWCSTFIKKKKILVKGEYANSKSGHRKAVIKILDPATNKVKGRSFLSFYLMPRSRIDFSSKQCVLSFTLRIQE